MDAGLAAVIAGAAGAGGAALAAFGTSLGLLRQAKMQGDHAHRLWLRNHQQQAFEELMIIIDRALHSCRDAAKAVSDLASHGSATSEERAAALALLENVRLQGRALQTGVQRVALLADEETSEHALTLCERVLDVVDASLEVGAAALRSEPLATERLEEAKSDASQARSAFITRAREMLQQP